MLLGAHRHTGLTLVELLVALSIMAVLSLLSWRTLEGMSRTEAYTQASTQEWLDWQTALAQWRADLDAMHDTGATPAVSFDGLALRLVRRTAPTAPDEMPSLTVVAWTLQNSDASSPSRHWVRWTSPPLYTTAQALADAWASAERWSRTPTDSLRERQVRLQPVESWQIFYHRGGSWTNPLSSPGSETDNTPTPDGIRLQLTIPSGQRVQGDITIEWVHPNLGGGKSL
jgi:general secretion pathway protein J